MTCQPLSPSLDICPDQAQITTQLLALLPRGRAFNTHEGPPQPNTTIWKFWNAVAAPFAWLNQRICDLRREFFCATASETVDLWLQEYGLPDGCDPFPDICVKVAALGGVTCSYYQAIAGYIGWSITCAANCTYDAGEIEAGMNAGAAYSPATLIVSVDLEASPAYVAQQVYGPVAGFLEAAMPISCGPDLTSLDCVLERIVHAETQIVYATY